MRGKRSGRWLWLVLLPVLGCGYDSQLIPAPTALTLAEHSEVAYLREAGVTAVINTDAWRGYPQELPWIVTPLEVRIENYSGRALKVSYANFALVAAQGFRYAPLPVMGGQARGETPPSSSGQVATSFYVSYAYPHDQFFIAPLWASYYPYFPVWPGPFYYDQYYYSGRYGYWYQPLPTQDMISGALPEGVLENGGQVTGFLYFPRVSPAGRTVDFEIALVDARTEERFGTIRVPFFVAR